MASLRRRMADFGFESNDNYEYHLRCLLSYPTRGLRCLNVEGRSARRKTAFASALAHAMDYEHVLYYDFTQQSDPNARVEVPDHPDEEGERQQPLSAFDRAVSEACAYSEAERTILILDQLQAADFREHIRIYHFVESTEWTYPLATLNANRKNFLLFLVSEEPLYHSLQKASFRVWTDAGASPPGFRPEEFGLDAEAGVLFDALIELFDTLGVSPTPSEFERILHDILHHVRTPEYLRHSIYGWTEDVSHDALYAREMDQPIERAMHAIEQFIGLDEIEVGG